MNQEKDINKALKVVLKEMKKNEAILLNVLR
jgi:hypothetical protein